MSKGQLPKVYLRLDPDADQHADLEGLVRLMCAAARQRPRGRFQPETALRILGRRRFVQWTTPRPGKEHPDLVELDDGLLYLDGWDEWQEGDLPVADRVRLLRNRRVPSAEFQAAEEARKRAAAAFRTANWRLRTRVYERDHYTCRYCLKADYKRDWLVAEHVIPLPVGTTTEENLVTACRSCNAKKGGRTPEQAGMKVMPIPTCDASRQCFVTHHEPPSPSEALDVKAVDVQSSKNIPVKRSVAAATTGGGNGTGHVTAAAAADGPGWVDHEPGNELEARLVKRCEELAEKLAAQRDESPADDDDRLDVLAAVCTTTRGKTLKTLRGAPRAWLEESLRACDEFERDHELPAEPAEEA